MKSPGKAPRASLAHDSALGLVDGLESRAAFSAAAFRINSPALSARVGFWSGIRPQPRRRASDRYHRCQLASPLDSATVVTRGMSAIPSMAAARAAAGVTSLTGQQETHAPQKISRIPFARRPDDDRPASRKPLTLAISHTTPTAIGYAQCSMRG